MGRAAARRFLPSLLAFLAVTGSMWSAISVCRAAGEFDPSFGTQGVATVDFLENPNTSYGRSATALAIQPADGHIVVVGGATGGVGAEIEIARLDTAGALDATFGTGGRVVTPTTDRNVAAAVAIAGDGKIVVGGGVINTNNNIVLARYLTGGALDPAFGSGGVRTPGSFPYTKFVNSISILPGGGILGAGSSWSGFPGRFGIVQVDGNGAFDPALGGDGEVAGPADSTAGFGRNHALVLPDGKIVVADGRNPVPGQNTMGATRLNADGSVDTNFGVSGAAQASFKGGFGYATAIVRQADGKLIVAGAGLFGAHSRHLGGALLRLSADGVPDATFGDNGLLRSVPRSVILGLAIQADGRILVADAKGIARYEADGSLDKSFGRRGQVKLQRARKGLFGGVSVALQSDGKIVAVQANAQNVFRVLRLLP